MTRPHYLFSLSLFYCMPFSLSHTHINTLTHTLSLLHSFFLTHSLSLSPLFFFLIHSVALYFSIFLSLTLLFYVCLFCTHTQSLTFPVVFSLSHTQFLSYLFAHSFPLFFFLLIHSFFIAFTIFSCTFT